MNPVLPITAAASRPRFLSIMGCARFAAVVAVCAALLLTACAPTRTMEALDLLRDVTAGDGPSRYKARRPDPKRREVRYCVAGSLRTADLYTAGEAIGGLVLVPGVARAGKDDPRLVAFARSLARARFVVFVPDIANLRALKVSRGDAREIAEAVRYLAGRIADKDDARVGLVAISYAVGPAILAAREESAGARVRFVLAIGGYYDMEAVVTFFTTGFFRSEARGKWRYREPNAYGKWLFVRANAELLADAGDRAALSRMAERKLDDPGADVDDLVGRLGPEGRRVEDLLANRDPEAVPGLLAALPAAVRDNMAALDVKRYDLSRVAARLYLIHGRDDRIIPYSESEALRAAAGSAELYLVNSLAHVDFDPTDTFDIVRLWRATYRLLGERDAMTAPVIPADGIDALTGAGDDHFVAGEASCR